jgi:hypothetical protein
MATKIIWWNGNIGGYPSVKDNYVAEIGEIFTVTSSWNISYVVMLMRRVGTAGNVTVSIYSTSGGLPTTSLGNIVVDASGWSTSASNKTFTFTTPISITPGTYAIIVNHSGGNQNNCVQWGMSGVGSGYPGVLYRYYEDPPVWHVSTLTVFDYRVWGDLTPPEKPINPTPVNGSTGIDFSDFTLSWENGGEATSYDVYIGVSGNLVEVSTGQSGITYITNIDEVPYNQVIYWRVDAVNSGGTTTGDEWNFDARPEKPVVPTPSYQATGIRLSYPTISWESGS